MNALFLPYNGLVHDSQLYAVQTLNRVEPGSLADDLFFKYGSQDKYSIFSTAAAPIVSVAGLHAGFALLYLLGNGLYLYAVGRLALRLIPDRLLAVMSAVALVSIRIPFGGFEVFHAYEPFLTPRLFAVAMVLLTTRDALDERWWRSAAWLACALALHPLMALGGVLLVGGLRVAELPRRWVAAGIGMATLGAVAALAYRPLGVRLFGPMDAAWVAYVRQVTEYNFASHWPIRDWVRVAGTVGICAAVYAAVPAQRRLTVVLAAVAGLSVVGNLVAENLPYALPLQGQPYRSLWLVQFLQVPLAFVLLDKWGDSPRRLERVLAGAVIGWVILITDNPVTWVTAAAVAAVFAAVWWKSRPLTGVVFGVALVTTLNAVILAKGLAEGWDEYAGAFDLSQKVRLFLELPSVPIRAGLVGALLLLAGRWPRVLLGFGACGLLPVLVFGPGAATDWYSRFAAGSANVRFVADHIAQHPRPDAARPCVHWAGGDINDIWFTVRANSYFNVVQLSGLIFNRSTATEGHRRMLLVRTLDLKAIDSNASLSREDERGKFWANIYDVDPAIFQAGIAPPTEADLRRLCRDPAVDWVVLGQNFPAANPVTNGRVFVYDAREVRRR